MKTLLRSFLVNAASLWLASLVISGLSFGKGYETLALAAAVLGAVNLFVRPFLNILLLPINVLTLGAFRWVVNVATLFLVTYLVPEFKITGFYFPGFSYQGIVLPATEVGLVWTFILTSFLLSLVSSFLFWLTK